MSDVKFPLWDCKSQFQAFKIASVEKAPHAGPYLEFLIKGESDEEVVVPGAFITNCRPEPGGYYVIDFDGYTSFWSAERWNEHFKPAKKKAVKKVAAKKE